MPKTYSLLYVLAMIAIIVGLDVTLLREHFWARLTTNVIVVLLFALVYFRFFRHT
jgi:hypothetical protein